MRIPRADLSDTGDLRDNVVLFAAQRPQRSFKNEKFSAAS
jgi:hypothetical protein